MDSFYIYNCVAEVVIDDCVRVFTEFVGFSYVSYGVILIVGTCKVINCKDLNYLVVNIQSWIFSKDELSESREETFLNDFTYLICTIVFIVTFIC